MTFTFTLRSTVADCLLCLAVTASVVGCGGGDGQSTASGDSAATAATSTGAATNGGSTATSGSTTAATGDAAAAPIASSAASASAGTGATTTTAAPGATTPVAQDGGTLVLRIDGPQAGTDHDELAVAGSVALAGTLNLQFADGYVPAAGQTFTLIRSGQGISGGFLNITNNKGLKLSSGISANNFVVTVGTQ